MLHYGLENLSDSDLISLLLRTGARNNPVKQVANALIRQYGVEGLLSLDHQELIKYPGISVAKAGSLLAAGELRRRYQSAIQSEKAILSNAQAIVEEVQFTRRFKQEHFLVLYLNARNELLSLDDLFVGTLDATLVHPREIYEGALRYHSAYIAVAHNHPSGNPEPSEADKRLTKRIADAGHILGIALLDHIIIGRASYFSFAEEGLLS